MPSRKEDLIKISKLERISKTKDKKIEKLKNQLKEERKAKRYANKRIVAIGKSRQNWRDRNKDNEQEMRGLKKQIALGEKIERHYYPKMLVILCVLLKIKGNCSYGSIVRIIKVLQFCFHLNLQELPCKNSIQNWVSKVGLYALDRADKCLVNKEVSLIIDESIKMGQEKQLLILCVPWKKQQEKALSYEDVDVLHIEGSTSWTGEKIEKVITDLVKKNGFKLKNILSDEDSKLKKTARLKEVLHVPEISHAIGTCLKRTFEKAPAYKAFTSLVASYQSKGVNQSLSYLCPAKQRSKARFMNQQRTVKWSTKLLNKFEELAPKAKVFFSQLSEHESIIKDLKESMAIAKAISLPLKKKGLSHQELQNAEKIIEEQKKQEGFVGSFAKQISGYLTKYKQALGDIKDYAIHISTEVIESIFGKYKSKAASHPLIGLTKLNLEIPLYCKSQEDLVEMIPIALKAISMTELNQWIKEHSSDSQLVKRRKFFKK